MTINDNQISITSDLDFDLIVDSWEALRVDLLDIRHFVSAFPVETASDLISVLNDLPGNIGQAPARRFEEIANGLQELHDTAEEVLRLADAEDIDAWCQTLLDDEQAA